MQLRTFLRNSIPNYIFVQILVELINLTNGDRGVSVGCYRQNQYLHNSNIFAGNVDICIDSCERSYYRYAVLDGNTCHCTNTIEEQEVSQEECDRPCTENHDQICGGSYVQSYYDTDARVAGVPQNVRIVKRSDTSILLQWLAPDQFLSKSLDQYIIRAKVIRKFGANSLPPLPQWMVEKNGANGQTELVNLNPGTTYNLTITSYSTEFGEGGTAWIIGETEIGTPDPPPQPTVVTREPKTMTIEIPFINNNNGPVTAVHVVVIFVDSELSQHFDESLLKNYKEAQEDGTNYYIAAELRNEKRKFVIGNGLSYGDYENHQLPTDRHVHASLGVISTYGNITTKRYALETSHEQHGESPKQIVFRLEPDDGGSLTTVLIVACCFFAILLALSIAGYVYLRMKMGPRLQRLPSDHHELTPRIGPQGPMIEVENNGGYQSDDFSRKSFDQKLKEILNQIGAEKKFTRRALALEVNNVIANGQFGDVIQGKLNDKPCQVHVVSDDMEPLDQAQFLKDLSSVKRFDVHDNIIEFYGICETDNWLYLLFEDTPRTLKTMLIESRTPPTTNPYSFSSLSEKYVLQTMYELSAAMEYLNKHQFIHRKLCAQNVRITADETAKINCFGATPFDSHGKTIDLTRWSAPEVLRFQHYSERSDVWSFGCLLWEIASLGGTLYPSINSTELISRIKAGVRPERIPFVYDDMNQLLFNCWQLEPSERPSFYDISISLRQFLSSPLHILSFKRQDGHLLPYYLPLLEVQHA